MTARIDCYQLAMSEATRKAIESGDAYRKGGVVYSTSGRIIEHLHDVELVQNANPAIQALISASAVPVVVFGASLVAINHRLEKIEAAIRSIKEQLEIVIDELRTANLKLDAQAIGKLSGLIKSCQIDINEGRNSRFPDYRKEFIVLYEELKSFVFSMTNNSQFLRKQHAVFIQYARAMFLAGVAARDLSYRMGEIGTTLKLSEDIGNDSQCLNKTVLEAVDNVPALFWRQEEHLDIAIEIRESRDRLLSHIDLLKVLPKELLNPILDHQVVS